MRVLVCCYILNSRAFLFIYHYFIKCGDNSEVLIEPHCCLIGLYCCFLYNCYRLLRL